MTVDALATSLLREQDEASDNAEMVTQCIDWISDAVDELSSACDWKIFKVIFPLNTAVATPTYSLHASVNDIRDIRFVDTDEPITYVDEPRLFGIAANLEEEGKPRNWFIDSQDDDASTAIPAQPVIKIRFHPIPDAIYPLMVSAQRHPIITPLVTTDAIPLRQEMLLAVKHRVRAYILANDKDYEGMNTYLQMWYDLVNKMIADETSKPGARMLVMQPRDVDESFSDRLVRLDPSHFAR